jgi:putative transposase
VARLPRLAVAGQAHLVTLAGHSGQAVFVDDTDRQAFLDALREAALQQQAAVHAYVLADDHVHLLLSPPTADALGALMQGLGRRYVAAFNRRHGRSGSLWAGRFRATVVQAGAPLLEALLFIDHHAVRAGQAASAAAARHSSAPHHLGLRRDPLLTAAAAYWQLGNTPFEREAAYRRLLDDGLAGPRARALGEASRKGWAWGDASFLAELGQQLARPLRPRLRGRPAGRTAP